MACRSESNRSPTVSLSTGSGVATSGAGDSVSVMPCVPFVEAVTASI
jgi:hypothetical protein